MDVDDIEFELLETILYDPPLDKHFSRIIKSAEYFYQNSKSKIFENCRNSEFLKRVEIELQQSVERLGKDVKQRVRLTITKNDVIKVTNSISSTPSQEPLKIILDKECTSSTNMFLYHKTTHRKVYEDARIRMNLKLLPGSKNENNDIFDVLMYNENNEITECSISNIAVEFYDQDKKKMIWKTPNIECGLLPGTMRSYLISLGKIICDKITIDELKIAQQEGRKIKCFNSVRKEYEVILVNQ
ncbi:hypothetical protein Glove_306g72 [Diversispora epigaea]|uniref:Uncharacterized protein n=1 Tax=Diversispora epigaea TaxID=1348612 RepID=A0A397I1A7_9GLOM|nr:hypothetical protein Glove_306g72 [Diversispora epigaea]